MKIIHNASITESTLRIMVLSAECDTLTFVLTTVALWIRYNSEVWFKVSLGVYSHFRCFAWGIEYFWSNNLNQSRFVFTVRFDTKIVLQSLLVTVCTRRISILSSKHVAWLACIGSSFLIDSLKPRKIKLPLLLPRKHRLHISSQYDCTWHSPWYVQLCLMRTPC